MEERRLARLSTSILILQYLHPKRSLQASPLACTYATSSYVKSFEGGPPNPAELLFARVLSR
jgi:hypothetical protein